MDFEAYAFDKVSAIQQLAPSNTGSVSGTFLMKQIASIYAKMNDGCYC